MALFSRLSALSPSCSPRSGLCVAAGLRSHSPGLAALTDNSCTRTVRIVKWRALKKKQPQDRFVLYIPKVLIFK
ncbi:MAG: hypothetical protein A4E49_02073 [Methanosaeta sp. PtaU1.Bin112]|nr:MAG: hypothetical protein A4E49_02073 [Methanosaeta sp. PtaU1.Bin112]